MSNSNWRYTTAHERVYPNPYYLRNDQQTQTDATHTLHVKDTGAQYSSPSDDSGSTGSDFDSDIEGTENITVAKRYLHRHFVSSEDLYTNPTPPYKRFRTSTPDPTGRRPEKEPIRCPLEEIINHRPALNIPPVDLIVAPGRQAANLQCGRQRLNAMAARGRNQPQPQPQPLQGADPALVQILQMMQNRDANRDNSQKQFLMFPKESFTGEDKKKAKSHWVEFSKYLDYQDQQGTIPRDLAHLPEIKSMFKLTLQDIAFGLFKTESPTWLTEDQMKQEFLKRFNPWGDTRRQQQDAWNKLKFDMTKDDVDSFVVDMKTLASILGHNDDVITEKFKDIFPDPNIEAALIAMDNLQPCRQRQNSLCRFINLHTTVLWHLPLYWSILQVIHLQKVNPRNLKVTSINWPLLICYRTILMQENLNIVGDNTDEDVDMIEGLVAMEMEVTLITGMIIRIGELAAAKDNEIFNIIEGVGKTTHIEVDEDSGMEMTLITMTEITGIEIPMVKVILIGVEDGIIITGVKDIVIVAEGEDGIPISNITTQGINQIPNFQIHIIIVHHLWDINTDTQSHMSNTHTPNNNNISHICHQLHLNKLQIFVSCVTVKAITIISANLQEISWPACRKPLTKADHITTKILIMGNGHRVIMTTMTLMANIFSNGVSRCR